VVIAAKSTKHFFVFTSVVLFVIKNILHFWSYHGKNGGQNNNRSDHTGADADNSHVPHAFQPEIMGQRYGPKTRQGGQRGKNNRPTGLAYTFRQIYIIGPTERIGQMDTVIYADSDNHGKNNNIEEIEIETENDHYTHK
jgi:hypothetical protein